MLKDILRTRNYIPGRICVSHYPTEMAVYGMTRKGLEIDTSSGVKRAVNTVYRLSSLRRFVCLQR